MYKYLAVLALVFVAANPGGHDPPSTVLMYSVKLSVKGGEGSGTVVGHTTYVIGGYAHTRSLVLTCAHVMEDATKANVQYQGHMYSGRLVAIDPTDDLALLEVSVALPSANLYFGKTVIGEEEVVAGYPLNQSSALTQGYLSAPGDKGLQGSAAVYPGNSGGGTFVYRNGWQLAGVTQKIALFQLSPFSQNTAPNVSFSIPMNKVRAFLKENGL